MKLGNTIEEMQRNYSETVKKSRKVGKILAIIGVVASVISLYHLVGMLKTDSGIGIAHLILAFSVLFCPISGYIAGHMYYYGFRRMASWLEGLDGLDNDGTGCLCVFFAFGNFGTIIIYVLSISLFFAAGMYIGLYDWIKIHIDAKRYGLKVK